MADNDLEYEVDSSLPPCSRQRIEDFKSRYAQYTGTSRKLPTAYVTHILKYHGGAPTRKCFKTASGTTRFIGRFLNFLKEQDIKLPVLPTWRDGVDKANLKREDDIRLDYSIWRHNQDSGTHWDRLADNLVPIAGLDTAGQNCREMAEIDLLCLDYSAGEDPAVVTWSYHESFREVQVTEFVADSFASFWESLHACPKSFSAAFEAVEHF